MGCFIVIEGLDGAGTTTQARRLVDWLAARGRTVHQTCEPSDGPVGRLIRSTLTGQPGAPAPSTLPWMFAADRADHLAREIEPALQRGDVVSDRYTHSSLAYQSLELPLSRVHALNEGFRVPDLTLLLAVSAETALSRIAGRGGERELFEQQEKLDRIAHQYEMVVDLLRAMGQPIVRLDGGAEPDAVHDAICRAVLPLVS